MHLENLKCENADWIKQVEDMIKLWAFGKR